MAKSTKQTVSVTLDSALYTEVRKRKINISRVAEAALRDEVARLEREQLLADIEKDLEVYNAYTAKHGSFSDMVRAHYAEQDAEQDPE
ncbi:MAG: type II toxin-antitoxin system CcdA family antitoxin [Deltaproteobacteria bacterium]|nr:type II toxin-antitoxin system CcdA family antitoxin [Deltaproteobacteria bacterium]